MLQNQVIALRAELQEKDEKLKKTKEDFQKLKVETMRQMVASVVPQAGNGDYGLVSRSEGRKCRYLFLTNAQTELLSSMIIKSAETDRILRCFGIEMPKLVINLMQSNGSSQDEWQINRVCRSAEELTRIEHRLVQWMSDVLIPFAVSHQALVLINNMTCDMIATCFARAIKMAEGTWNGPVPISVIGMTDMTPLAIGRDKDPLWEKIRNQPKCEIWQKDELFNRHRAHGGWMGLDEEDDDEADSYADEPDDDTKAVAEDPLDDSVSAVGSVSATKKPRAPKCRQTEERKLLKDLKCGPT